MSDFEDRLGRALGEGSEQAPGVVGLADAARARARRRARRVVGAGGATVAVVLALVVPFTVLRGGSDVTTVADAGDGWRTVSFERESYDPDIDTVTVLVDVPDAWVELGDDEACGSADLGVAVEGCSAETVSVLADSGNLDFTFAPGLRTRDDYGYPVDSDWLGYVDLGGAYVNVSSDAEQVALRVLASARFEGTAVPELAGEWPITVRDGVGFPDPGLDESAGYGVEVGERTGGEESPYAEQVAPDRWRAAATVGDRRIEVVAPTSAIAQVVAGSARAVEDVAGEGWRTVTYEGDPVNESGDRRVVVDLPPGWERLDTSGCEFAFPRFGLPGDDPCGDESSYVAFYGSATFDPCCRPGLFDPDGSEGYVYAGSLAAYVTTSDRETARRILASVRLPGDSAPSASWRSSVTAVQGTPVELPDDGSVDVTTQLVRTTQKPTRTYARATDAGRWVAEVDVRRGTQVRITAPTQALADLVASMIPVAD